MMGSKSMDLETVLQKVNRFIALDSEERRESAKNFDVVRDYVLKKMQATNPVFKRLYNGPYLAGSCADNLKVSHPDEYDLVIHMKLPHSNEAEIELDEYRPGYVKINIYKLLVYYYYESTNTEVYNLLKIMVDENGYLLQVKFQSWIEGILAKIELHNNAFFSETTNRSYSLKYRKTGPAHTCYVTVEPVNFSIDIVPALLFNKSQWPPSLRSPIDYCNWLAIPKPIRGIINNNNISWQISYVDSERNIIGNKHNLKNTLRMLKKLRSNLGLENFKSYFIKTLYLWECEQQDNNFWNKSTSFIFLHMLQRWCDCLSHGELPFYWDTNCNLLANLDSNQIQTMHGQLKKVCSKIAVYRTTNPENIFVYFLNKEQMKKLNSEDTSQMEDDILMPSNKSSSYFKCCIL